MHLRQWLMVCAWGAAITLAIYFLRNPIAVGLLILSGRVSDCAPLDAAAGVYRNTRYHGALNRLAPASREIRRDGSYKLVETPRGKFWEPENDGSEILAQLAEIESKYWAKDAPIRRGDVVLDCGANIGVFTRAALDWGARLVVAIEPAPDNVECLRRNFAGEIAATRVIVLPKGVWDREEILTLYQSEKASALDSFVRAEDSRPGPKIPLTTIDRLIIELKIDRVDFIKMDIEGAEPKALHGARQTLTRFHPRLELEAGSNAAELVSIARQAWTGYRSECLVCANQAELRLIRPTIISLR